MPDISMCLNEDCKLKTTCKRFMATPSQFNQTYMKFEYSTDSNGFIACANHSPLSDYPARGLNKVYK